MASPGAPEWQHAATHLGPAVVSLALVIASRVAWRPPAGNRGSRLARRVLVTGLATFAAAQIVEAAGAFGFRGFTRVSDVARLHDIGVAVGPPALLVALVGAALSLVARYSSSAAPRRSARTVALLALAAVVVAYVLAGIVWGF